MDIKKLVKDQGLSASPIGLGGCKTSDVHFDSCSYDLVVFDEQSKPERTIKFEDKYVKIHHASIHETSSKRLLSYEKLEIIQDESWDLRMLVSKIREKRSILYADSAKNSLIESLFCTQKTMEGIKSSSVFAPCWQKCASFCLADAISFLNSQNSGPSHMLDLLRNLKKNPINKHIAVLTQTIGIERATPTLLERMLKSTMGFSDMVEKNDHSQTIQKKYDFFVENSMFADCYFYLGYINKENFLKIKADLHHRYDLIHILKIAFDIEADPNLLSQQAQLVQKSCNELLELVSRA